VKVIVRPDLSGPARWLTRKRLAWRPSQIRDLHLPKVPKFKVRVKLKPPALPGPDELESILVESLSRNRARMQSMARKLGTAAVGVTMFAVTAADGTVIVNRRAPLPMFTADARIERLRVFFDAYACPAPRHIADYLRVADTYGLDYRILPALSVRESTCGQYQKMNNRWGWDSGQSGFGSIASGIEYVARQLAEAPQYKGKTLDQLLWTYNPRAAYPGEIKKLMERIEP
jgi:hypothetical protein